MLWLQAKILVRATRAYGFQIQSRRRDPGNDLSLPFLFITLGLARSWLLRVAQWGSPGWGVPGLPSRLRSDVGQQADRWTPAAGELK